MDKNRQEMKFGFLTPEYPHPKTGTSGGIGTSIKNLANGLIAAGASVTIIVYGQSSDSAFEADGITIYRVKNVRFKGISWLLTRKKIERLINKLHKEREIDFIEAPDWTGITSFIAPSCPVVIRMHGCDTYFCDIEGRKVKWWNRFHEKRALQRAQHLLSVSQFTAMRTKKLFGLSQNITVIPNCVPYHQLPEMVIDADSILYFGTLIRKKGMIELPYIFNRVVEKHPTAKLILLGKDAFDIASGRNSTYQMMQELFSESALANVRYMGGVTHEEVRGYIANAALCVFPSFAEALPVSWLEAMQYNKAVVASNIGWASEIIDDGVDGFLVHPTDHEQFADKISLLLSDKQLAANIALNAQKKVEQVFSTKVVVRNNIAFFNSILTNDRFI